MPHYTGKVVLEKVAGSLRVFACCICALLRECALPPSALVRLRSSDLCPGHALEAVYHLVWHFFSRRTWGVAVLPKEAGMQAPVV